MPVSLMPALRALKDEFDDTHFKAGDLITERCCYAVLHDERDKYGDQDELRQAATNIVNLKAFIGPDATENFNSCFRLGTQSACFAAFFDLYLSVVAKTAEGIFKKLLRISRSNRSILDSSASGWTLNTMKRIVRSENHKIMLWTLEVCDGRPFMPMDDPDGAWRAPAFLLMKPLLHQNYDATIAWNRLDAFSTVGVVRALKERYVLRIEGRLKDLAGAAEIEDAEAGLSTPQSSTSSREQRASVAEESPGKTSGPLITGIDNSITKSRRDKSAQQPIDIPKRDAEIRKRFRALIDKNISQRDAAEDIAHNMKPQSTYGTPLSITTIRNIGNT